MPSALPGACDQAVDAQKRTTAHTAQRLLPPGMVLTSQLVTERPFKLVGMKIQLAQSRFECDFAIEPDYIHAARPSLIHPLRRRIHSLHSDGERQTQLSLAQRSVLLLLGKILRRRKVDAFAFVDGALPLRIRPARGMR